MQAVLYLIEEHRLPQAGYHDLLGVGAVLGQTVNLRPRDSASWTTPACQAWQLLQENVPTANV
jgi:hypothetical protein